MTTLRDVSRRAHASIGSVSAVLNGTAPVSADMRARILQAVEDLGYVPHSIAVSLKSGRSRMIGLVLPDITNPHFAELARVIEHACDDAGFMLTLCSTSDDHEKELKQLHALRARRADGIIFISGGLSANDPARLRKAVAAPVVIVDRFVPELQADSVLLDNEGAADMLTQHLLVLGHTSIGLVAGADEIEISRQRVAGYRAALSRHGVASSDALVVLGGFQPQSAYEASLRLLDRQPVPTAVVATSNHTTIGLMRALAARGVECPSQISVAAIDDFSWAEGFRPRLTVAAQPTAEMGRQAVAWLLDRIGWKQGGQSQVSAPRVVMHQATLIVRGSTAAPANAKNAPFGSGS